MSVDTVPYLSLVLAALLVYAPRPVALWAQSRLPGGIDNAHPRAQQATLVGLGARAQAAHTNAIEAFAPFAAGVLACEVAGVEDLPVAVLCVVFVVVRTVYMGFYLGNLATARSVSWGVGAICSLVLLALPLTVE